MPESNRRSRLNTRLRSPAAVVVVALLLLGVGSAAAVGRAHGRGSGATPTAVATASPRTTHKPLAAQGNSATLVPATGAYLGAVADTADLTQQGRINAVLDLESAMGRRLGIVHVYHKWNDMFPSRSDAYFLARGSTLMVSWAGTDTRLIASGAEDTAIRAWAKSIKSVKVPLLVEWRWEMDRPNLAAETWSGPDYVKAWDHIRDVFASEGATNAVWVWCPTAAGFANGRAQAYYPGPAQVDWVCADAYAIDSMQPLASELAPFLDWARGTGKPIMIGEFGAEERGPGARARWLLDVGTMARNNPQIKALVYFDYDSLEHARLFRWSLGSSPSAMAAFRKLGREPGLQAGS